MSNTSKVKLTGDKFSDAEIADLLIGNHVKFKYEGWTKVYRINILRAPDNTVVLSVNEGIPQYSGLKKFLSEEDPTVCVKCKRWWKLW